MDLFTLILITVGLAITIMLVGALVSYMSSLVKSAYQIRVELRNDMDGNFKQIGEDLEKRSKWLKRDMVEELGRVKDTLTTLNEQKFVEMRKSMLETFEEGRKADSEERRALFDRVTALEERLALLEKERNTRVEMARKVRDAGSKPPDEEAETAVAVAMGSTLAASAATPATKTSSAAPTPVTAPTTPTPKTAPSRPTGPGK
ncbi:MAG: hypothetical protein ACPGOY_08265 [Rhodospirillaceae bacterium]